LKDFNIMNFDRDKNYEYFLSGKPNDWMCPTCEKGNLIIDDKSLESKETNQSKKWRAEEDDWEPEYIQEIFNVRAVCSNKSCNENIFIIGNGRMSWEQTNRQTEPDLVEHYYPKYFNPPINLFSIAYEVPSDVEEEIKNSFALFWADKSACGNAIRKSVECICDDKKINKNRIVRGKRKPRSLDERIKELGIKNSDAAELLLAIKWLGNHGSHGHLDIEDIFDAYELLIHALDKLYINKEKRLKSLSKRIIKKKGPA
jgi:hypothetical protein